MTQPFGGPWTAEKLEILSAYLNAYTTALKSQFFDLVYLDAFAGNGWWQSKSTKIAVDGSARIALKVDNKPFDKVVLIEKDPAKFEVLRALPKEFPGRDIVIKNGDANDEVAVFCRNMQQNERAVVFLDPFATDVHWQTLQKLAQTRKVDCWILFARGTVARMMQRIGEPNSQFRSTLDLTFGGREHWESLYSQSPHVNFWGEQILERDSGSEAISNLFRTRLESIFAAVLYKKGLPNSKNSTIFDLFFAVSNQRAVNLARKIVGQSPPHRSPARPQLQRSLDLDIP